MNMKIKGLPQNTLLIFSLLGLLLLLSAMFPQPAFASDQFVAEIRIFSGNFAPTGWAMCNGQLLSISQNTALFSLLGTYYGGDGKTTFALPDLQGRVPIQVGQGSGLSDRLQGEMGGAPTVSLLQSEMPVHTHSYKINTNPGTTSEPDISTYPNLSYGRLVTTTDRKEINLYSTSADTGQTVIGGSSPHNNMQPYLVMNYIIALQGIFPPRT